MAMFNCPTCYKTIGELPKSGTLLVLCADCHFKYEVLRGRLIERTSVRVGGPNNDPIRRYVFRLDVPNRDAASVKFARQGPEEVLQARPGDDVVIVHTMRGSRREEVLAAHNLTTGESFAINAPGRRSKTTADTWGVAVGILLGGGMLLIVPLFPAALFGLFAAIGTSYVLAQRLRPVHDVQPDEQVFLERKQSWLSEKLRLQEARARIDGDIADRQRARQCLVDLQHKMLEVGLDAYKPRLHSIDVALAVLDKQTALDLSLRDGYDRSIKMIEIEQDASAAEDIFPDDLTPIVLEKLDELKALEEQQAELARELETNVEIEQLLRTGRSDAV